MVPYNFAAVYLHVYLLQCWCSYQTLSVRLQPLLFTRLDFFPVCNATDCSITTLYYLCSLQTVANKPTQHTLFIL